MHLLKRTLRAVLGRGPERWASEPATVFPDDTFIVSYPRSGNTWLRRLIATARDPGTRWGVQNIDDAVPDIYRVGPRLAALPRPRIMKSHEAFQPAYPRVIYLHRDGRDVAVSYHNYYRTAGGQPVSFDEFLHRFIAGQVRFGRWDAHVRSWLAAPWRVPLLTLSYEGLCRDTGAVLAAAMDFLGCEVSREAVAHAVQTCTFERHLDDIRRNSPEYATGYRGGIRGGPGMWRETFSESQRMEFWASMGPTMEMLGYLWE